MGCLQGNLYAAMSCWTAKCHWTCLKWPLIKPSFSFAQSFSSFHSSFLFVHLMPTYLSVWSFANTFPPPLHASLCWTQLSLLSTDTLSEEWVSGTSKWQPEHLHGLIRSAVCCPRFPRYHSGHRNVHKSIIIITVDFQHILKLSICLLLRSSLRAIFIIEKF